MPCSIVFSGDWAWKSKFAVAEKLKSLTARGQSIHACMRLVTALQPIHRDAPRCSYSAHMSILPNSPTPSLTYFVARLPVPWCLPLPRHRALLLPDSPTPSLTYIEWTLSLARPILLISVRASYSTSSSLTPQLPNSLTLQLHRSLRLPLPNSPTLSLTQAYSFHRIKIQNEAFPRPKHTPFPHSPPKSKNCPQANNPAHQSINKTPCLQSHSTSTPYPSSWA